MKNHDDGRVRSIHFLEHEHEHEQDKDDSMRYVLELHYTLFVFPCRYALQNPMQSVIILVLLTMQPTYLPYSSHFSSSDGDIHSLYHEK